MSFRKFAKHAMKELSTQIDVMEERHQAKKLREEENKEWRSRRDYDADITETAAGKADTRARSLFEFEEGIREGNREAGSKRSLANAERLAEINHNNTIKEWQKREDYNRQQLKIQKEEKEERVRKVAYEQLVRAGFSEEEALNTVNAFRGQETAPNYSTMINSLVKGEDTVSITVYDPTKKEPDGTFGLHDIKEVPKSQVESAVADIRKQNLIPVPSSSRITPTSPVDALKDQYATQLLGAALKDNPSIMQPQTGPQGGQVPLPGNQANTTIGPTAADVEKFQSEK